MEYSHAATNEFKYIKMGNMFNLKRLSLQNYENNTFN